ncbi:MAG: glutathione S-transferase N-terminal domain-containing protein [Rhodospirillaceae bacterium]
MGIILHELAFQNDILPSPYCWRVRLALEHKGLAYSTLPAAFTAIRTAAGGGHKTVPILEDQGRPDKPVVGDSWVIANYLEDTYPDRPPLFGAGEAKDPGRCYALALQSWIQSAVMFPALKVIVLDIYDRIQPQDRGHFLETRERRFGMTLEAFTAGALDEKVAAVRKALEPVRAVARERPFLSGAAPTYADYVVAGFFFWWRAVSPTQLLTADDPLSPWFERILARYGRIARESVCTWQGP